MKELLYGAAYYDEYMPYERLAKDVSMMQNPHGVPASLRKEFLIFLM